MSCAARGLAVVAGAALLAGCRCGDAEKKPAGAAPVAEAPERERAAPDLGPARAMARGRIRPTAPVSLDDARAAMPPLPIAEPIGEPSLTPKGDQARFNYCVPASDLAAAAASVASALRDAGWSEVTVRPPDAGDRPPRHGVAASRGDLRLGITVNEVKRTGCDASLGRFFTSATMTRVGPPVPPQE